MSNVLPAATLKSGIRIVLDTSVLISAAINGVQADYALHLVTHGKIQACISLSILDELQERLENKLHWEPAKASRFQKSLLKIMQLVDPIPVVHPKLRDPGDLHVLGTALTARADLIITTDKDLLILKRFKGIGIIHPKTLRWTFPITK